MNSKLMKKITVLLTALGLFVIPLTGCNSNVKLFGKEIISIEEPDDTYFDKTEPNDNHEGSYTEEDAVAAILEGTYDVTYKGEAFSFDMTELASIIFPDNVVYTKTISDSVYQVKIDNGIDYVIFEVNFTDGTVNEVEMLYDGDTYKDEDAHQMMLTIITVIIDENGSTNTTIDSL